MKNARKLLLAIGVVGVGACASLPFLRTSQQQSHIVSPTAEVELPWRDKSDSVLLEVRSEAEDSIDDREIERESPRARLRATGHGPRVILDADELRKPPNPPALSSSFSSDADESSLSEEKNAMKSGSAKTSIKNAPDVNIDGEFRRHRVIDGDTLEALAEKYLGDANRSKEIFEANRDVLTSPDTLPIDVQLVIPVGSGD
jgi:nucleoid-associated protein YgaU